MWWEQEETTLHSIQTVGFNFHHKMAPIGSRPRLQIFLPYSAQCFARNKALKLFVLSRSWPLLHVGKLPFCTGFWWPRLHSHCDVERSNQSRNSFHFVTVVAAVVAKQLLYSSLDSQSNQVHCSESDTVVYYPSCNGRGWGWLQLAIRLALM